MDVVLKFDPSSLLDTRALENTLAWLRDGGYPSVVIDVCNLDGLIHIMPSRDVVGDGEGE